MAEQRGRGQTALITGASGGIGLELARRFAADGWGLVLLARGGGRLQALATELADEHRVDAQALPVDLTSREAPQQVAARLAKAGVAVDALVNNAGYGLYGRFASETDMQTELDMIQLNVVALTQLTKLLLPPMLARGRGRILNVASTAAFQAGPLMAVYYATKAYVLSFSEALANELGGSGVSITTLCPGPTPTGFQRAARMEGSRLLKTPLVLDAAAVARAGYAGMMKGRGLVVPGIANALLVQSVRLVPRRLAAQVARMAHQRD